MDGARLLIVGGLALAAILGVSAVIVAMAPYLAGVILLVGLVWYLQPGIDEEATTSPNEKPKSLPTYDPRE